MTTLPRLGLTTLLICSLPAAGCGTDSSAGVSPVDPYGDYGVFLSIVPPGSADVNTVNIGEDPNALNQLPMYENLVFSDNYPTPGALADEDLAPAYFKDEAFLPESEFQTLTTTTNGAHSARIGRDDFGVPHIFGDARGDVMFGTGYATGADRMFLVDVIRHFGRGRMSDFLGPSEGNLATDIGLGTSGGYSEQELQDQIDLIATRLGVDGPQAQQDVEDFVAGINQYIEDVKTGAPGAEPIPVEYELLNLELRPFTGRDVIAVTTLIFSFFATGGGGEDRQVQLLHGLSTLYPDDPQAACELWRDIRQADDPERPNTTELRFETQSPPSIDETACPLEPSFAAEYPGAVMFDAGSLQRRELLGFEECVEPSLAMPGDVECPNFGEDVVDDPVTPATAARTSVTEPLMSLASVSNLPSSPPVCSLDDVSSRGLDAARMRARTRVDGIVSALQSDSFARAMSNAILAGADETESGHPIAVFGPQTGYFSPQIMMEFSQQGGGIHARGMAFAGMPYVIIGRGIDHAFSATSAGDDIIDVRVLRLCEEGGGEATRDSTSYLYDGVCTPMLQRTDEWTAETNFLTSGVPNQKVVRSILRAPDYGPVYATATVDGEPVALAIQRSTFFGEADSVKTFLVTSRNEVTNPESFYEAFNNLTGTFNWLYVDADNIAYFNSSLLPDRAEGIHPDLPQWGTGEFDWKQTGTGFGNPDFSFDNYLPLENHPRETNPESGYFVNWNNGQAPGFYANDGQTSWGPTYRSDMLKSRLQAYRAQDGNPLHSRASMVEAMIDAGTTDLRGEVVLPVVFDVLDDVSDLDPFEQEVVQLMKDWVVHGPRDLGAMRRDRDGPGLDTEALVYEDHSAVAFMDAWWDHMIDEVLPQLTAVEDTRSMVGGRHNAPGAGGSAFQGGYYGYVLRVLEMALGRSDAPYKQLECANTGALADCRAALVESVRKTIAELGSDMSAWDPTLEADDAIDHTALGLADPPNIHWQNRPTWQQVIQPTEDVLR
ncbi:MAG: penicillin acylase family protein [Polyangiales bacterium]